MDTRQALETALREAMRARNEVTLRTIRSVLSSVKLADVEKGIKLDEAGTQAILQKEIKSRRESIADAQKANRPDLIAASEAEIVVLEGFLPKQLNENELADLVKSAIEETGASGPADMGKVMKAAMTKVQGRAPGDAVSQTVRKLLAR